MSPTANRPDGRVSRKVTDEIIERLRQDITTGLRAKGTRLPNERDLAAEFGVSQPTIREVARVLEAMGLIEVRHGSGAWVRGDAGFMMRASLESVLQLEQAGVLDVLDVRALLGRQSAVLAATAATAEDLDELERSYRRLDQPGALGTLNDLIEAIEGLQVAVAAAAHNPLQSTLETILVDLLLNLQIKALRQRGLEFWRRRSSEFQPDRRAIVDAIRSRDPEGAGAAMSAYLDHQRAVFVEDKKLLSLRLSDPRAVQVASDLRHAAAAGRMGARLLASG
jgi:GntR family transcriptional regulator, transcriptional repressor for pyruvate dehydrogenase complex